MRTYHDIRLNDRTVSTRQLHGEAIVKAGRYLIAKTLVDMGAATVDPLSPDNPLIFSAGPFAGTSFSNANRTSVGCKSPLTGGIKEANGGGTFSYGLGQLKIAGFTLLGASPDWEVIHFRKDGSIHFDDGTPYLGKGNFEANDMLHARYGKKVTIALNGPVGEYLGLIAGIAFSDKDGRPSRLAVTRPTSRSTCRCFDTEGCSSSSASAISPTERSSAAMNSRMCRRRGSATALKGSEVVEARGTNLIYSYMGICQVRRAFPAFSAEFRRLVQRVLNGIAAGLPARLPADVTPGTLGISCV